MKISILLGRLLTIFLIAGLVLAPLSAPVDCDQCPLMAICMVTTLQAPSSAGVIELRPVAVRLLAPRSDPEAESLGYLPPPRPPRSLVRSA